MRGSSCAVGRERAGRPAAFEATGRPQAPGQAPWSDDQLACTPTQSDGAGVWARFDGAAHGGGSRAGGCSPGAAWRGLVGSHAVAALCRLGMPPPPPSRFPALNCLLMWAGLQALLANNATIYARIQSRCMFAHGELRLCLAAGDTLMHTAAAHGSEAIVRAILRAHVSAPVADVLLLCHRVASPGGASHSRDGIQPCLLREAGCARTQASSGWHNSLGARPDGCEPASPRSASCPAGPAGAGRGVLPDGVHAAQPAAGWRVAGPAHHPQLPGAPALPHRRAVRLEQPEAAAGPLHAPQVRC